MFKNKNRGRSMVLVIGCSRFGARIASENSMNGIYTSIIDMDPNAFRKLDESYSGFKIIGNAEETAVLEKGHIDEALEVDITTGDDNLNIFLAYMISKIYEVPYIYLRLRDETKIDLVKELPVKVISPSYLSVQAYHTLKKTRK